MRVWLVICSLVVTVARAETPPDPSAGERPDGRMEEPGVKKTLLVVPRLTLAIPRQVLRGLSWPIRWLTNLDERYRVYHSVMEAITSADGLVGVRLAVELALDLRPMAGLS